MLLISTVFIIHAIVNVSLWTYICTPNIKLSAARYIAVHYVQPCLCTTELSIAYWFGVQHFLKEYRELGQNEDE
jgi:hypothetical protein